MNCKNCDNARYFENGDIVCGVNIIVLDDNPPQRSYDCIENIVVKEEE